MIFFRFFSPFLKNFDFVAFFSLKMAENGPKNDLIKKNILLWRSQYCNNVMCAILKEFNEFWVWGLSSLKMAENGPKNDLIKKNILLWRSNYCNNVMCAILKEFKEFWVWGLSSLKMAENGRKWPDHKKFSFYDARDMVTMSCVRYWKNSKNFDF